MIKFEINKKKCILDFKNYRLFYENKIIRLSDDIYTTPEVAYIKLNNLCNLSCIYCFQKKEIESCCKIQLKDYKWIDQLQKFKEIILFGGEPLLDINFFNLNYLMSVINEKKVSIFTNGCYNYNYFNFIKNNKYKIKEIIISLDGPEFFHNQRRKLNNGNSYKKILKNIKQINRIGLKVVIQVNIDKDNLKTIKQLLYELNQELDLKANIIVLNKVLHENNIISELQLLNLFVELKKSFNNLNLEVNSKVLDKLLYFMSGKGIKINRCGVGHIFVFDFNLSQIYTCPQKSETYIGDFTSDKIKLCTKKQIQYKKYSNKVFSQCNRCHYKIFCKFGCIIDNDLVGNTLCKLETLKEIKYILNNLDYFIK